MTSAASGQLPDAASAPEAIAAASNTAVAATASERARSMRTTFLERVGSADWPSQPAGPGREDTELGGSVSTFDGAFAARFRVSAAAPGSWVSGPSFRGGCGAWRRPGMTSECFTGDHSPTNLKGAVLKARSNALPSHLRAHHIRLQHRIHHAVGRGRDAELAAESGDLAALSQGSSSRLPRSRSRRHRGLSWSAESVGQFENPLQRVGRQRARARPTSMISR